MKVIYLFLLTLLFFFSFGCIDKLIKFSCGFAGEESDHCIQFGAVQTSDDALCEEIKGKKFSSIGSNPPKDKCYLLIANKTNNPALCDKIEGGLYSYTKEECLINIAKNTGDPKICNNITSDDIYLGKSACLQAARSSPNYSSQKELNQTQNEQNIQNKTIELENKTKLPAEQKTNQSLITDKEKKEQKPLSQNLKELNLKPLDQNKISEKTNQILTHMPQKSKEEIKQGVEQKEQTIQKTEKIPTPPNSNSKEQQEGYLSKAWSWIGWGGEKAKDVYEGVGEQAPTPVNVISTASKGTEAIKDVSELGESYNRVNEQIQKGKITSQQGQLLKTGYTLGKGIKWVAKNVPIVGDTVGEVADKSFEAGMKFGEKLAAHTTKTNKCIEDPLSDECLD